MAEYAVVLAARMTSARLPGKALVSYCPNGMTNLEQIARRWQTSDREPVLMVVTPESAENEAIAETARKLGLPCWRGPESDVANLVRGAVQAFAPDAKYIARALADNPLVDVAAADWRLDVLRETEADGLHWGGDEARITYAATTDIWSRAAWEAIWAESSGSQREHPGTYFWENLHRFTAVQLPLPRAEFVTPIRTELDTEADLAMFRALWAAPDVCHELTRIDTKCEGTGGMESVDSLAAMKWLAAHPAVAQLNADVPTKTQTRVVFDKGRPWVCKGCAKRMAAVVNGDLEVRCAGCGKPHKFYATPPNKRKH